MLLGGQAPQEPTPTFRQGVEAVQLSVIVTDREGNPVSGLTADDFEVLEDKVSRPITTFAAVEIPIERVERTLVEKDVRSNDGPPGRLYVIALDQMAADSALRTRRFLRQFIETVLRAERYRGRGVDHWWPPRIRAGLHEQSTVAAERHRQV